MQPVIRASEIGSYLYCRRAWWYRKQGVESENQAELAAGTELHLQHGRKVMAAGMLQFAGYALLLVAAALIASELARHASEIRRVMSALERIAHFRNRRDEVPNQELARDLAARKDRAGIREIAENLWNKDKGIQADCVKVLYEVGYLNPHWSPPYAEEFLKLLKSKNNRLVWGGMIALARWRS